MGPPQGPYILQLCMGPSYFWGGSDPPLFRTLTESQTDAQAHATKRFIPATFVGVINCLQFGSGLVN